MKNIEYTGPYDEVEVPLLGQNVKKGKAVEVTNANATILLRQETWVESKTNTTNSKKEATE